MKMRGQMNPTSLRECCGIIDNTIGPTPAKYRPLPRSRSEIQRFLRFARRRPEAEALHEDQLRKVADQLDLKTTDFKNICERIGESLVEGCKRTDDLRRWAELGLLPAGVFHERHLLNLALSHVKSTFVAMEAIAKRPKLNRNSSPARPIAVGYFVETYRLVLKLMRVAYGEEFEDYFYEWQAELLVNPKTLANFGTLEPLSRSSIECGIPYLSLSNILPDPSNVPLRHFPFRDDSRRHMMKVFPNGSHYGPPHVFNEFTNGGNKEEKAEKEQLSTECMISNGEKIKEVGNELCYSHTGCGL